MDKYEYIPNGPVKNDKAFTVARVTFSNIRASHGAGQKAEPAIFADANTFEQACDLARMDRARMRDLQLISDLERHEVKSRATGHVTTITIPV